MQIQSEQINEIAAAMAKAQGLIQNAKEDKKNPFFKSSYADLASVWESCRHVLSENGLSVIQTMMPLDGQDMLVTTLTHASGQWIRSWLPLRPTKNDPQGLGACITYMKRYALAAIVGVATEDDDGEGSIDRARITVKEAMELQNLLEGHEDIKQDVNRYLSANKWKRVSEIPKSEFQTVKNTILKKIELKKESGDKVEKMEQEVQHAAAN